MESHPALVLPRETDSMIKTASTTISRITAIGNTRRNSAKARPKPNGKINGNPIGII
jgi:hypothetical protein